MNTGINRDEWLKALADAGMADTDDQGALTIDEFAAMFDLPRQTAEDRLRRLATQGRATRTSKRGVTSYGRRVTFVAYRLTEPQKKAKRR